ncbi:hypothetical protein IC620_09800 [Hazenella sp. IB182357]|uniref:Uncharacterized protein n=1 Tax=Polycladospora coralii TaxID=2771432 RepID=A0A926RUJ6_9BACL|nr:hypothetical protein [Polycladospora coralii]MBD1372647.1 hypothetical protein [Polycladospora coralii]MBS7531245.1 hypothetical protein [Polycladospora coralii]
MITNKNKRDAYLNSMGWLDVPIKNKGKKVWVHIPFHLNELDVVLKYLRSS